MPVRRLPVRPDLEQLHRQAKEFLRAVHAAGCRRFGIVLGSDADAFHRDHLHFDMGQGPYCR